MSEKVTQLAIGVVGFSSFTGGDGFKVEMCVRLEVHWEAQQNQLYLWNIKFVLFIIFYVYFSAAYFTACMYYNSWGSQSCKSFFIILFRFLKYSIWLFF